jgi:hypothetical protein
LFKKYEDALAQMPDTWKKIAKEQTSGASAFEVMTAEMSQQLDALREMSVAMEKQEHHLQNSDRLWTSISRSSKSVSSGILTATTSLLKWTGILGAVGGILGLLDLEKRTFDVAGWRRSGMGRGINPGAQRAFDVNFDRLLDTDSYIAGVAEWEGDITKQSPAFALLHHGLTGNTEQDALALLRGAKSLSNSVPLNMLGPTFHARGLDQLFDPEAQRRLRDMKPSEFEQLVAGTRGDSKEWNMQDAMLKKYQEAATALEHLSATADVTATKAFGPLADKIPELTSEFEKAIKAFANAHLIKEAIDDIAGALGWVKKGIDGIRGVKSFYDQFPSMPFSPSGIANTLEDVTTAAIGLFSPQKGSGVVPLDANLAALDKKFHFQGRMLETVRDLERSSANAISPKGAMGMFQLMPGTAKQYGVTDPMDPAQSALGAARYLGDLTQRYQGDLAAIFASYNWGQANVDRVRSAHPDDWFKFSPTETQRYLMRAQSLMAA